MPLHLRNNTSHSVMHSPTNQKKKIIGKGKTGKNRQGQEGCGHIGVVPLAAGSMLMVGAVHSAERSVKVPPTFVTCTLQPHAESLHVYQMTI